MKILKENENGRILRSMIKSKEIEFIMEAHNGISAKIVEETGFKALWASGLSMSSSHGVRDNNELSHTQVAEEIKYMSNACNLPILVDADTGYGDFNSARISINNFEHCGASGIVIEDKIFPKVNSFLRGEKQPLEDPNIFAKKLEAIRSVVSDDFVIIARLESFITGYDLNHALERAKKYASTGVIDGVLVHSKKSTSADIDAFMEEWNKSEFSHIPIIIVPTKYYSIPVSHFKEIGISTIIWANHNVRASIKAIQETSKEIFETQSISSIEDKVVSVNEIFRLQNDDELKEAEKLFSPTKGKDINAIILAASRGTNMDELTKEYPKCFLKFEGTSIIERQIEMLNKAGIKDITIVSGYKNEVFSKLKGIEEVIFNESWEETKDAYSLKLVKDKIKKDTIILFGDIIFNSYVLNNLIESKTINPTLVVDSAVNASVRLKDIVIANKKDSKVSPEPGSVFLESIKETNMGDSQGEFIGMWSVKNGNKEVVSVLENLITGQSNGNALLNEVSKITDINIQYIKGGWIDVDSVADLQKNL